MRRVSLVAAFRDGLVLFGKRADNGRWTMPGGHLDEGETWEEGARRELKEETGLDPVGELKELKTKWSTDDFEIRVFRCEVDGAPTGKHDPDAECKVWAFFDVDAGIPKAIAENMAGPKDPKKNVAIQEFGLEKREGLRELVRLSEEAGGYQELEKHEYGDAPRGFVDPKGMFYPVEGEDHHDWIGRHFGADEGENDAAYGKALQQGWMSVGIAGDHNVQADPQHLKNPNHPATMAVRNIAKKHWGPTFEAFTGGANHSTHDTAAFAGRGHLMAPSPFAKSEDDEVERLLLHPNKVERSLALKLHGVKGKHLTRAFRDEDPGIQQQALEHEALDHGAITNLMAMPDREHLALQALNHPKVHRDHLEALYDAHRDRPAQDKGQVMHAISHHALLDQPLIERMLNEGNGHEVVENLHVPPAHLERLVAEHMLDPEHPGKKSLARRALRHPAVPQHLVDKAFAEGPADVKQSIAQNPNMPEALAHDVMMRGQLPGNEHEAMLRHAIVGNPVASDRHLATGAKDRNALVRQLANHRLGKFQKFEAERDTWLLTKAVRPQDLQHVGAQTNPQGPETVDHTQELRAHPPAVNDSVQAYRNHVLNSAEPQEAFSKHDMGGVTRKAIYRLPDTHQTHAGDKFMVKPYHEQWRFGKRPVIHGWAEMTNQALYHAGDIGHLHQSVHVAEHNMGRDKPDPALVIHMKNGMSTIDDAKRIYPHELGSEIKHDARRIGLMDFLTGNIDRHNSNLMVDNGDKAPSQVMAIDHGLGFQYNQDKRHASLSNYDGAADSIAPRTDDASTKEEWGPVLDWWSNYSTSIRRTMNQRLAMIKKPELREHLSRNFEARADWLDQMAHRGLDNAPANWYNQPVDIHHLEDSPIGRQHPKEAPKPMSSFEQRVRDKLMGDYDEWKR